ncbi:MAG: hypothetical protein ACRD9W_17655, partial [Terriglobia bacterium]
MSAIVSSFAFGCFVAVSLVDHPLSSTAAAPADAALLKGADRRDVNFAVTHGRSGKNSRTTPRLMMPP